MLFPRMFSHFLSLCHHHSPLTLMHTSRHAPSSGSGSSPRSGSGAPPPARDFWAELSGRTGKRRRSDPGPSWCSSCTRSAQREAKRTFKSVSFVFILITSPVCKKKKSFYPQGRPKTGCNYSKNIQKNKYGHSHNPPSFKIKQKFCLLSSLCSVKL